MWVGASTGICLAESREIGCRRGTWRGKRLSFAAGSRLSKGHRRRHGHFFNVVTIDHIS